MIVVDSSAIIAVLRKEVGSGPCLHVLTEERLLLISASTFAETLIVAGRKGIDFEAAALIEQFGCEVIPFPDGSARQASDAYSRWGKGVHPAKLNLGDCFAYALARDRDCPLLFIGNDFSKTDITPALDQRG